MKLLLANLIVGVAISAVIGIIALATYFEPIATLGAVLIYSLVLGTIWACSILEQEAE